MEKFLIYVGAGLGALSLILFIIENIRLGGMIKKYKRLIRGLSDKNIEEMMISYSKELDIIKNNMTGNLEKRILELETKLPSCLRNIGMVTYNAFENIGNNMSFSIAALDDHRDGFILTGIYSREHSYVYAKQIKNGQPMDKELSKEEKDALLKAQNK